MKIVLALVLTLILSACGFESQSEFKEDKGENVSEEKMEFPEIKYIEDTDPKIGWILKNFTARAACLAKFT